jgi:4-diphosphocytidyl-2-C-methyl-D-erythritol kinase
MLKVTAPAKINLTLEVLGKRPDGFHEIRSVLQTVNLCDTLQIEESRSVTIESDMPGWSGDMSLIGKTVALMHKETGYEGGVDINKRIPLMSGLGGDSSGAAAALRGLNELWGLGLSQEKLLELAAQLGSDVAFFIWRGTALAEGRGELVTPLPPLQGGWVVLVVPDIPELPGKTARLYAALKPLHYTDGHITRRVAEILWQQRKLEPSMLFNTFENVAFDVFPGLKTCKEHLIKLGAPHVHLAGSGPALFTLLEDKREADDLLVRCQNQRMRSYVARVGQGR